MSKKKAMFFKQTIAEQVGTELWIIADASAIATEANAIVTSGNYYWDGGGNTITSDATEFTDGLYSVKVVGTGNLFYMYFDAFDGDLAVGTDLVVSFSYKVLGGTTTFYGFSRTTPSWASENFSATTWTEKSYAVQVTSTSYKRMYLDVPNGVTIWIDKVSILKL